MYTSTFKLWTRLVGPGLKSANNQLRKKACDVLFFLYRSVNPGHTRYHFDNLVTEDSAKELREQLIETIRDEFDRMDGKPTKKEIEVIVMIYEIILLSI